MFFEYCVYVVEGKGRTIYYKTANTCLSGIKSNQNSRDLRHLEALQITPRTHFLLIFGVKCMKFTKCC